MITTALDRDACADEFGLACQRLDLSHPQIRAPFGSMWCVIEPGGQSLPDQHAEAEMVVVVRGRAEIATGQERAQAGPGTLLHLEPERPHVVHNASDTEELVFLSLYWDLPEGGAPA